MNVSNEPSENLYSDEKDKIKQIANYYTKGDKEKTELMVSGFYNDLYVLKVKLTSSYSYGAFIIFFNHIYFSLQDCYGIISKSYLIDEIKISDNWNKFEKTISETLADGNHDAISVFEMLEKIKECFTIEFCKNLQYEISINDRPGLSRLFKKEIFEKMNLDAGKVDVDVDFEEISSVEMELKSISSIKLTPDQLNESKQSSGESDERKSIEKLTPIEEEKDTIDINKVKLVLDGSLALDPIKGMHISGLVVNDQIKIKLTDENPKAIRIAQAFNAYKDKKMLPITGKIISYRRKQGGGYKIFVEIADGIYVRIDEEEGNIKIAFVAPSPDRPPELQVDVEKYVDKYVLQKQKEKIERLRRANPQHSSNLPASKLSEYFIPIIIGYSILILFFVGWIISKFL